MLKPIGRNCVGLPKGSGKSIQDILIGLDLDGTVLTLPNTSAPRNLAAIEAAVQAGIIVLPATGRTATGVPQAFTGIPGVTTR